MVNYQNGKIYKIESHLGDKVYIGSTTKDYLSQRMDTHRMQYKSWKDGKHNLTTSFKIFDEYGLENCQIILLESYPCNSKDELVAKEAHYIKTIVCVNKVIPNRTQKEYRKSNKEKIKEEKYVYREANKDKIKEYKKIYREENIESIKESSKKYYEANKYKFEERYETNREELIAKKKEVITCECCGKTYTRTHKSDHLKSKYHLNYKKE